MDTEKLIKLDELKKKGLLTEEEYEHQKAKLLSNDSVNVKPNTSNLNISGLAKMDPGALLKNKELIFSVVALIGFLLPWLSAGPFSTSGIGLSDVQKLFPDGGLILFLFPLSLIGVILSNFLPQVLKYKKILIITSILSICWVLFCIIGYSNYYGGFEIGLLGIGFYLSLVGTVVSAWYIIKK
jgi:hypothetical protein